MARYYRCLWYDPRVTDPTSPGHPLYVPPRQGAGRVDDPDHEYRVRYLSTDPIGAVAETFGAFAVWTPALLTSPPRLPGAFRAIAAYDIDVMVCDLDDPKSLMELGIRPSQVVSSDRRVTQGWARQVYDTGQYDGVSWWSRHDARWTCTGLWRHDPVVRDVTVLFRLTDAPIAEAASALDRPIGR